MPAASDTALPPNRIAPVGLVARLSVTGAPGTSKPERLSRTCTDTAGATAAPTSALVGDCRKKRLAPVGVTSGGSVRVAVCVVSTACDDTAGVTAVVGLRAGSTYETLPFLSVTGTLLDRSAS